MSVSEIWQVPSKAAWKESERESVCERERERERERTLFFREAVEERRTQIDLLTAEITSGSSHHEAHSGRRTDADYSSHRFLLCSGNYR